VLTLILLLVCLIATVIVDLNGEPPNYLVGLLGTAAGAFFTALGTDKSKREADVSTTARRAEATADRAEAKADAADTRADAAEKRETGQSQHRDQSDPEDGGGT
jgi:hypothetical protein